MKKKKAFEPKPKSDVMLNEISQWLKKVKFKRKLFRGVDEADVWQKIDELNSLYEKVLLAQRAQGTPAPVSAKSEEKTDE